MRVCIMIVMLFVPGLMNAMDDTKGTEVPVFGALLYQLSTRLGSAAPSIVNLMAQNQSVCIKSPSSQTVQEHCAEHIADQLKSVHQSKPSIVRAAAQIGVLGLLCGAAVGGMLSDIVPGVEFIFPGVAAVSGVLCGAAQAIQEREQIARQEGYIQGVAHTMGIHQLIQSTSQRRKTAHSSTR